MIVRSLASLIAALVAGGAATATVFTFDTDPFAGSTALETPGRQVVGNELFIPVFDIATDVLAFNTRAFDIPNGLGVFNGPAAAIPAGINVVVLADLDADGDPSNGIALNAGSAATLIANSIGTPGAGFFVYFNSGLDLPRLVYSTDLGSVEADLKVLARFNNLAGQPGRDALAAFTAGNFAAVPEPASWAMLIAGFGLVGSAARRRPASRRTVPA